MIVFGGDPVACVLCKMIRLNGRQGLEVMTRPGHTPWAAVLGGATFQSVHRQIENTVQA